MLTAIISRKIPVIFNKCLSSTVSSSMPRSLWLIKPNCCFYHIHNSGKQTINNQKPIFQINKDEMKYFSTKQSDNNNSNAKPAVGNESTLKLSESCIKQVEKICNDQEYLRVIVDGGGCSGFQYKFEIDTKLNEDDVTFGPNNRVVIDSISLDYCAGSTLDYQIELIKSGFRMINNPKAEQGCSCGASFALKF